MNTAAKPAPSLWQGLRVALDALEEADADATLVADALALVARVRGIIEALRVNDVLSASGWERPPLRHDLDGGALTFTLYTQRMAAALGVEATARPVDASTNTTSTLRPQPITMADLVEEMRRLDERYDGGWTPQYDQRPWPLTQEDFIERIRRNRRYEEAEAAEQRLPLSALDPIPHETAEITAPDLGHPRPTLSFDLRGLDQLRAAFADLGREMNEAAHRAWPGARATHTLSVDPATFRTAVAAVRDTVRPAPWTTGYAERARGRALRWRRLGEAAR